MAKELKSQDYEKIKEKLNAQFSDIQNTHKNLYLKCVKLGVNLTKLKAKLGHGNWDKLFSNVSSGGTFGRKQAGKMMQISGNSELCLIFFKSEIDDIPSTINGICKRISNATDEEKAEAEEIKKTAIEEDKQKAIAKELAEIEKAKEEDKPNPIEEPAQIKEDEPVEAEFTEVEEDSVKSPTDTPALQDEPEQAQDILHEALSRMEELEKSNDEMTKVFEADDSLKTALDEVVKLKELVRITESRFNGLMNERNEAIREAKRWKNKYLKLEKKLKELGK